MAYDGRLLSGVTVLAAVSRLEERMGGRHLSMACSAGVKLS
jgi:hypothetical protein